MVQRRTMSAHCGAAPGRYEMNVIFEGLISLACLSIAGTLLYFVHRRIDLEHRLAFVCVATFIAACGTAHAMAIWALWHPTYRIAGAIELITAIAAVSAAVLLIRSFPSALRLPAPSAIHRIALLETLNQSLVEDSARSAIAADAAGLGFWTFDVTTNVLDWDESMYRLYGLAASEGAEPDALRESRTRLEHHARSERSITVAQEEGRDYDAEFDTAFPNGVTRHLKAIARVTRNAEGHATRMLGVTFDITERKHADERFRLAIEAAPTGMLLTDHQGFIVLVNAQIEKLFGYPRAELLGQPMEKLIPQRLRISAAEIFGLRKDGSEVPIEIGLNPLLTSDGEFFLSSIVDLSQRLEIERIRNEFVSTVSHELRTPLTSIRGSLGLLQSGAMGALPDNAAEMVTIAYKNSGRLVRIINDILDVSTIEAGKLALQMRIVALAELLQQSVEANAGFAEKCEVRFVLEQVAANDRVMADPDRLMQVVANLLSNAAKFSPPGSDVLIRVSSGAATLRIEVQDSGAGIPDEFKALIFTKFAQADASATRHFEGTGLGLSIARKLTEAMGGTIGFDSRVGQGSVFYIELPRVDAAPQMLRTAQLSETAAHKVLLTLADSTGIGASGNVPRLLYVEDDEDLISVMRAALADRVEIVPARTVQEAERLLCEEVFDLVILDQLLPDGNAIGLVDRIPGYAGHPLPIMILSAADVPRDAYSKVAAVLIKSQVSAAQVATTILTYLALPSV
jgi:PAS domain S-box-containing protein